MIVNRSLAAKILGLGLLLVSPASLANEAAKPLAGVWGGTLGEQAITACFNAEACFVAREYCRVVGNYYYQRYLLPIDLNLPKDAKAVDRGVIWKEKDGTWHIEEVTPNVIRGTWTNPDESISLPIRLARVERPASDSDEGECGSDAYNSAIEASPKIVTGAVRAVGNIQYQEISMDLGEPGTDRGFHFAAIQVLGNSPAIESINESLRASLQELFAQRRFILSQYGSDGFGFYTQELNGVSVIGHWLIVKTWTFVGSAGDRFTTWDTVRMWNLSTGEPENLLSWFRGQESVRDMGSDSSVTLPNDLNGLPFDRFDPEAKGSHLTWEELDGCYGAAQYRYNLRLTEQGITFELLTTSNGSCGDSFAFTFAELAPFLNEKGRKAVAAIEKSQKSPQRAATGKGNM
jgi:hypothetical protein